MLERGGKSRHRIEKLRQGASRKGKRNKQETVKRWNAPREHVKCRLPKLFTVENFLPLKTHIRPSTHESRITSQNVQSLLFLHKPRGGHVPPRAILHAQTN